MKHRQDIHYIHRNPSPYHELTEVIIEHYYKKPIWSERLFIIVKDNIYDDFGTEISICCKARVIMEYDSQEIEQIKQYIKEVYKDEKEN